MKSNLISKSETSALLKIVSERWEIECPKLKNLKVHQIADEAQIITGEGIKILKIHDNYLPFLSETVFRRVDVSLFEIRLDFKFLQSLV